MFRGLSQDENADRRNTLHRYRTYFKPDASGKRLIWMSHCIVVGYAVFIASFSVGLYYAGISMGYLYLMMGVIISSAVLPATLTLTWAGQNKWAVSGICLLAEAYFCSCSMTDPYQQAALSPILGLAFALIAWLVTAKKSCGSLGVSCTGSNDPMLAGNVVALLSPLILVPIFTLIFGLDHYDWASMKAIRQGDDHELANAADLDVEELPGGHVETTAEFEEEQKKLLRAGKISKTMTVVMTLAFLVLWPMRKYLGIC